MSMGARRAAGDGKDRDGLCAPRATRPADPGDRGPASPCSSSGVLACRSISASRPTESGSSAAAATARPRLSTWPWPKASPAAAISHRAPRAMGWCKQSVEVHDYLATTESATGRHSATVGLMRCQSALGGQLVAHVGHNGDRHIPPIPSVLLARWGLRKVGWYETSKCRSTSDSFIPGGPAPRNQRFECL